MIRLQRVGRKNIPTFRVVLTDKRNSTKSGRYLEALGAYDPRKGGIRQFDADKIKHWISKGAKPTETLHNIFIDEKIITGKKINVLPRKSPVKKEEKAEAAKPAGAEASIASTASKPEEKKEKVEAKAEVPGETKEAKAETPKS